MEENIRKVSKMRISTYRDIAVKRGRVHRFSKWCAQKYKTSWRGIYESFRDSNTPLWKIEGMENCVREFKPSHKGSLRMFWKKCVKNRFAEFMVEKNCSRVTLWKRFQANDWNELEKKGIKAIYHYWLENVELKEMVTKD